METVQVNNATPSEAEVETAVRRLFPLKAGGHTHLRVEHFKQWQQDAYPGDQSKPPRRGSDDCAWYT